MSEEQNKTRTIGLSYGVLSDPIAKQLDKQGFKYDKEKIEVFQREITAINTLRFGSELLTDSLVEKILPKLHKKIVAHIAKANRASVSNSKA